MEKLLKWFCSFRLDNIFGQCVLWSPREFPYFSGFPEYFELSDFLLSNSSFCTNAGPLLFSLLLLHCFYCFEYLFQMDISALLYICIWSFFFLPSFPFFLSLYLSFIAFFKTFLFCVFVFIYFPFVLLCVAQAFTKDNQKIWIVSLFFFFFVFTASVY